MQETWQTETLRQGPLELVLMPGLGGRLWDVSYEGFSLLFQNDDLVGYEIDLTQLNDVPTRSPQFGFPLWGGEKTWIAPDRNWPDGGPHKALDSGPYNIRQMSASCIEMQSAICPDSGLKVTRQITLINGTTWTLRHQIANQGSRPCYAGIWSVLMLCNPTTIGVDSNQDRPATQVFGQAGDMVTKQGPYLTAKCIAKREFKIGDDNPTGRVFLKCGEADAAIWLCVQTPALPEPAELAHQHNFEIFNSGDYDYCEAEWHSQAQELSPGETLTFTQTFIVGRRADLIDALSPSQSELELIQCMS